MSLTINSKAYFILLKVLLSCRCPVSDKTEKKLIRYYKSNYRKRSLDYDTIINIANKEEDETVFHRLKEFCICSANDLRRGYEITIEDVLRHFSSSYHWKVIENPLHSSYKKVIHIPSWFVSHLLLPIKIRNNKDRSEISFSNDNHTIQLKNLFIPSNLSISAKKYYCVHFASVISDISSAQFEMLRQQLNEITLFNLFCKDVKEIDYLKFQRYGNYFVFCKQRYGAYFK